MGANVEEVDLDEFVSRQLDLLDLERTAEEEQVVWLTCDILTAPPFFASIALCFATAGCLCYRVCS